MTVDEDDVRLLGSRTLRMMTRNWLPGGRDLGALSTGGFAETIFDGIGFGLGFGVLVCTNDDAPGAQRTANEIADLVWEHRNEFDPDLVSLEDAMISMQKANVSFQAAVQVRNRLVSSYHDIMNMQV